MSEEEDMQPSEIAREVLRQLALRRIAPTPDNYLLLYNEISGTKVEETFPQKTLKHISSNLPTGTTEQVKYSRLIDTAVNAGTWEAFRDALKEIFERGGRDPLPWGVMLKDLFTQLETHTSGFTQAKKRESLDHVLRASAAPDILFQRLQNVVHHWSRGAPLPAAGMIETLDSEAAEAAATATTTETASSTTIIDKVGNSELRELIAKVLEDPVHALLNGSPELAEQSLTLAKAVRQARQEKQINEILAQLKQFSYKVSYVAEDQTELRAELLGILKLLIDNIGEIVVEDQWLHGQINTVSELLAKPLDLRALDSVERMLKDVIYKQSGLKKNLQDANNKLKQMLATFVDRLGDFSSTTSDYHDKIEACAVRISSARDISELSSVLEEVMQETRAVQLNAARSHDEISEMRQRVSEAEREVKRLQVELSHASEMVRLDPLTGALNRKGLEEAMEREVARTRRHESPLSFAMLDIDNFKQINDTLGHKAGDSALQHLAEVTRETIRPQDTLVRYGGEEFVILLPETAMEDAIKVMERVQRELTRRYFLHDNNKLLITFSAGVAELANEEDPTDAVRRADQAMYLAKRAGKNRVMAA